MFLNPRWFVEQLFVQLKMFTYSLDRFDIFPVLAKILNILPSTYHYLFRKFSSHMMNIAHFSSYLSINLYNMWHRYFTPIGIIILWYKYFMPLYYLIQQYFNLPLVYGYMALYSQNVENFCQYREYIKSVQRICKHF